MRRLNNLILGLAVALVVAACASTTPTTPAVVADAPAALLSGRDTLASVQGEPHVLWFWGAH